MILKAVTLVALIVFFVLLALASFIATIIGLVKRHSQVWRISLLVCVASICLSSLTTVYTGKKAVSKTHQVGQKTVARARSTTRTFWEGVKDNIKEFIAPSPATRFTRSTGFAWPESAEIITSYYEDFLFDWTFYLVFKTDRDVLETWLTKPPPWEVEEWTRGPLPRDVLQVDFGSAYGYWSDGQLEQLLESDGVWYAAKEYCCSDRDPDLAFHGGALLIIDLDLNQVWYAVWDH